MSTNIKKVIASYVVELTANENGSQLITVTPQEQSEVCSAQLATGTYWGIYGTIQQLLSELLNISNSHRQSKFSGSASHPIADERV